MVRRERLARLVADSGPQIQFSEALPGTFRIDVWDLGDVPVDELLAVSKNVSIAQAAYRVALGAASRHE